MPTIVGILTFISMINTNSERLKARNVFICWYFSVTFEISCSVELNMKKCFITSGPDHEILVLIKMTHLPARAAMPHFPYLDTCIYLHLYY